MRKLLYGFAVLVIAVASTSAAGAGSMTKVYNIKPIAPSLQSGTITFQAMGLKTKVTINITKEPAGAAEPSHIHVGSCKKPGAVTLPLTNVVHGSSVTVLNVPISKAAVAGTSVNIHQSAQHLNVYVACGDITAPSPSHM